jgi:soluble lytic murein transglycosylase-like protein
VFLSGQVLFLPELQALLGSQGLVRLVVIATALLALVLPARALRADLYSWVDEDGVIHLTNVAEKVPASYKPYAGDDAEGFGGQKPLVTLMPGGEQRVFYPVDVKTYDAIIREAAEHYRLPFAFIKAVAKVESNFNPRAVSVKDAKGLMQMIDATANDMSVSDPFDAKQSIFGGARYLRILANMFDGNMALTAAAYNAGPDRVQKLKAIPNIPETQRYVRRVLTMYRHYRRTE